MNDNYLLVLNKDYVSLQLNTRFGLCDQFKLLLLDSHFIPLHCRANGDIVTCRKPAMERLIRQTLQSRLNTCSPVSVSILLQFKTFDYTIPRRLDESPRIPPKIGGGWTRAHIPYLNVEPVIPLLPISDNKIGVTATACVCCLAVAVQQW
ncbi:hypothetical protein MHU86_7939 [Fragilaria crotonensis]|nr:hypothetical protein MHU86_7939 [Fragilaria crotonensis]